MKTKRISVLDNQRKYLKDSLSMGEKRPVGYVEIFDKKTGELLERSDNMIITSHAPIHKGPNLIVYSGRHWLMQRACNQSYPTNISPVEFTTGSFLSWLGVGHGGALVGSPLTPIAPLATETGLTSPSDIYTTPEYLNIDGGYCKKFDSIQYVVDPANDPQVLIAKLTTTITASEANVEGSEPIGTKKNWLNEAALFVSNSTTAADVTDPTQVAMFAKVTFSTIVKNNEREIVFIWSIYF